MGKWEMVRLGDVGKIITGNTPKTSDTQNYSSNDLSFFKPSDISENNIQSLSISENFVSNHARSQCRLIPPNSVLVTCIGIIGKICITACESTCNQQINAVIPDKRICDPRFLAYAIFRVKPEMNHIANSAVVPIINKSQFSDIRISLPPLQAQQKIADILDRANALIEKRKEQIAKLDLLVKSQFIEMFGDPVTNPKGWEVRPLGELGELNRGVSKHRPRNDPKLLNGEYPLIQTGEVASANLYLTSHTATYSEIGLKQSKMWPKNTLCITIAANIAKTAILGFDACFPDSIVGFISGEHSNQLFIHHWFSFFQEMLEEQAPQSAQKNINLQILREVEVIVPPINLQDCFADFVNETEISKIKMQQGLAQLEMLYKSLMQKCFDGGIS